MKVGGKRGRGWDWGFKKEKVGSVHSQEEGEGGGKHEDGDGRVVELRRRLNKGE